MLTLVGFSVSNYHNKVKLALLEKGLPFAEELNWASKDEQTLSCSPLGKVPFLKTGRGSLCESVQRVNAERKANAELMARERPLA